MQSCNRNARSYRKNSMNWDIRTVALVGMIMRQTQEAFERLAMIRRCYGRLSTFRLYFSRDILNEGVDIVEVNQVIMLRPTQSPIVFIQQLGRD